MSHLQNIASYEIISTGDTQVQHYLPSSVKLGNWLASRGLPAEEVNILRRKHNQRVQNIENEDGFLALLQATVKSKLKQPVYPPRERSFFLSQNDLDQIKDAISSPISEVNEQLADDSDAAGQDLLLDALLVLPDNKILAFINFMKYDTTNDRMRFIRDVLPFFVTSMLKNRKRGTKHEEKQEEKPKLRQRETVGDRAISPPQESEPEPLPNQRKRRRVVDGGDSSLRVNAPPPPPPPTRRRRSERIQRRTHEIETKTATGYGGKRRKRS